MSRQVARYFQTCSTSKQRWSNFLAFRRGCDRLVGNQTTRLPSCGVVILSEFLSPHFDLNSSAVRNVLRGWIAFGDIAAVWMTLTSSAAACLLKKHVTKRMLLVSTGSLSATRIVSLPSTVSTTTLSFSRCQWICALVAYRSGNVLRCSLSMFRCTRSWLDAVITLVTSAPFLAKHRQRGFCFQDRFSTDRTKFEMQYLLLVHLFTPSMPRTVGQTSSVG